MRVSDSPPAKPLVIVVGAQEEASALVQALSTAGELEARLAVDAASLEEQRATAAAVIALGDAASLAVAAAPLPVLVVGGRPEAAAAASLWLPAPPSLPLLLSSLRTLLAPAAPVKRRVFRRKSDMIIGDSQVMHDVLHTLDIVAPSTAPVLITGESGTGKELIARALHSCGPRSERPFVAINCAAIPETLFEAELFGYARGAFTGAVAAKPGLFEAADGGTLFLDELGETTLALQPKLLRVLETGDVVRLGGTESRHVDVRVIAATNHDLERDVRERRFREDLYYRLSVCRIRMPALRERPEDIPLLIGHHLGLIATRENRAAPALMPAALERLLSHDWPGNVRELVAVLQRAVLLSSGGVIQPDDIQLPDEQRPLIAAYRDAKEDFDRRYYTSLLATARGKISLAARLAQKTRKEIYMALRRLDIAPDRFRSGDALADAEGELE